MSDKPLTLEQAFRLAHRNRIACGEPFFVTQHRETGEYCVCRQSHLYIWLDVFKVVPKPQRRKS